MNWQIFCDWLWAPIIAPFATYCIGKLLSRWKYGRQLFRKLTLGNPEIALIADHTEQNNISKSIASTGLFKEKNITCETFTDTHNPSFHNRFDIVIIVFDYEGKPSNPKEDFTNHKQEEAERILEEHYDSFKTTDEPIVVFAKKMMNRKLFNKIADRANTSICQARGRLTADIIAQLTAFNG